MPEIRRQLIEEIAIFGALSKDTLGFLLSGGSSVCIPQGDYLFHEGDPAQSMFVVEQGKVAALKTWRGEPYVLGYFTPGACIGEMALMDLHPRSASIVAIEDTQVFELDSGLILKLYEHDAEQFVLLQMNLGREVSRRLREADERMFIARISPEARRGLPRFQRPGRRHE